jgi:hypothetical protein
VLATSAPDHPRAFRLSGPTNGIWTLRSASTLVEAVVDVHHDEPGVARTLGDRDERPRIGRRDHDRVDPPRDHLLHELDLPRHVLLVLDAGGDELVLVGVLLLVPPRTVLHRLEELVRERLHDERDDRTPASSVVSPRPQPDTTSASAQARRAADGTGYARPDRR